MEGLECFQVSFWGGYLVAEDALLGAPAVAAYAVRRALAHAKGAPLVVDVVAHEA